MLSLVDLNPDPGKEIEVDPDPEPDPRRGLKWIRIRIRSNAVDPGGSGSETLFSNITASYGKLANYWGRNPQVVVVN